MNLQMTLLLVSFFVTVVAGAIIIPILQKLKVGQNERDDGPKSHLKKQGTPTMGGIMMIASLIIVGLLSLIIGGEAINGLRGHILALLFVPIGFGVVGFLDDYIKLVLKNTKGLKPAYKMIGLLVVSIMYSLYLVNIAGIGTGTYIPFVGIYIDLPVLLYIPFIIFVMLATTNAVNLTDGIDGLASSVVSVILLFITTIAMKLGAIEASIVSVIVCGACIGFLLYNMNKARVFMGDTGSLFLGGVIAAIMLYLRIPFLIVIMAIVPVAETLSVIIQVAYFKKTGKRIFKMAPLHHHFELTGWNENKVVKVFTSITVVASLIGLILI